MKIYWSSRSPFVRKAMVAAHEAGLAGRIEKIPVLVAMTMEPTPAVMANNPLNKIPTLITDDGMVLFESVLVCEYLDSLHSGPKLFPAESKARWQALRRHALGTGLLEVGVLWRSESRRPHPMDVVLKAFAQKTQASLDLLEREAQGLAGSSFQIGHIAIACALAYLDFRFKEEVDWRASRPGLARWFEETSKRPSMQATQFVDA